MSPAIPFGVQPSVVPRTKKKEVSKVVEQAKVNQVVSVLTKMKPIKNRHDLDNNLKKIISKIIKLPDVFDVDNPDLCYQIFEHALQKYCEFSPRAIGPIKLNEVVHQHFNEILESLSSRVSSASVLGLQAEESDAAPPPKTITGKVRHAPIEGRDDLLRVTQSYDKVMKAHEVIETRSTQLADIVEKQEFSVSPHVIIGAGDIAHDALV